MFQKHGKFSQILKFSEMGGMWNRGWEMHHWLCGIDAPGSVQNSRSGYK